MEIILSLFKDPSMKNVREGANEEEDESEEEDEVERVMR
jgi:hypothetical protein